MLKRKSGDETHWLTISDLMSGLMILFIFIAIGFMRSAFLEKERANNELKKFKEIETVYAELIAQRDSMLKENDFIKKTLEEYKNLKQEKELIEQHYLDSIDSENKAKNDLKKIKDIAETYQANQEAIYNALTQSFPEKLLAEDQLNAEIDKNTLTFIFKSSDSLFDNASANLKEDYKKSLVIFFPKFIEAIPPYKDSISEIRIEGHTSSEWGVYPKEIKYQSEEVKKLYSYFENMKLSQARTNSVLNYVLSDLQPLVPQKYHQWIRDNTAAVGLSSSKPILNSTGIEDPERSRRVTFRIITNADKKIQQILQSE